MPSKITYNGIFLNSHIVVTEDLDAAKSELNSKSGFGTSEEKRLILSLVEGLYLLEKERLSIFDSKSNEIDYNSFVKKAGKLDKNFLVKYYVYRDMRTRGYLIKTALKYGADFRVYDRGAKPGDEHAKWILYAVSEHDSYSWKSFVGLNRVAHSVRKRLLVGIVDSEGDVTYYEISWQKP